MDLAELCANESWEARETRRLEAKPIGVHWTRARYRKAQHLSRLLDRIAFYDEKPLLVLMYRDLVEKRLSGRDPLERSLRWRLDIHKGDDIPF